MKNKESRLSILLNTAKSTLVLFLATVFTISALIYLIYQINKVDTIKREIDRQKQEITDYNLRNNRLKKEIVELEEFSRIKNIASKESNLGVAKSAPIRFRVKKDHFEKRLKEIKEKIKN